MEKIAFFGKGGIGKSTLSANISAIYARSGRRVLHVGCDPKHDSSVLLIDRSLARTVLSREEDELMIASSAEFVMKSRLGIDCVEAGGPEPGIGCAGRGISKMIDIFDKEELLARGDYQVTIFDVLGDVVCGGFAAPLRQGFAEKVVIVVSEEIMSLYAANNISHAVRNYAGNNVSLCGLLANMRDPKADLGAIERFAARIGTTVLGSLTRDPDFRKGEYLGRCLTEFAPRSKTLARLEKVADRLLTLDPSELSAPAPMDEDDFYEASRNGFPATGRRPKKSPSIKTPASPASVHPEKEDSLHAGLPPIREGSDLAAGKASAPEQASPESRWMMWTWGVEGQWREFFADAELWLNSAKPAMKNVAYIAHKELECHYVEARTDDGSASYFNHAWPDHCVMGLPNFSELRKLGCRQIVTDIRDSEVIMGGNRRLESAIARLSGDLGPTEMAVVLDSCPPVITGDDLDSVVKRFRGKSNIPVIFPDRNADQHTDILDDIFAFARETPEFKKTRPKKRHVNLVGLPWDESLRELSGLLNAIGITVNSCLLPEYDMESLRRYPAASLQILSPHRAYEDFSEKVLSRLKMPTLKLDPPYGITGTHRWLERIAAHFGLEKRFREVWAENWGKRGGAWDALREEARDRALGFVCDAGRLKKLRDCRWSAGIGLLPTLREMGFGLKWLLWCPCGGKAHPKDRGKEPIRRFQGPKELSRLLRDEPIDAVYSDFFFDHRLSRAGKAQFSLPFFEPGLDGAFRSFERLLGVCRLPFYKSYSRYLGKQSESP